MSNTPFVDAINEASLECARIVTQAKERVLQQVAEANGWGLYQAVRRLELHEHIGPVRPWFQVFDRRRNCYVSPKFTWGFDENVFSVKVYEE